MILDGKATAAAIKAELAERVKVLASRGITPGLATVLVGDDPASHSYVKGKHKDCAQVGINSIRVDLPATASQQDVASAVDELNNSSECTGYIVQLPLPKGLEQQPILEAIDPAKDADGLHPFNLGQLAARVNEEITTPLPCTPAGVIEILRRYNIDMDGANVAIVGRSMLVGRPLGMLMNRREVNATVTLCHTGTRDLAAITTDADIVVAAAGVPAMLTPDLIREGAVVVDVGINRVNDEDGARLVGDVHPDVERIASAFTPVPGGIGPMTRAMLLANVVTAAERSATSASLS